MRKLLALALLVLAPAQSFAVLSIDSLGPRAFAKTCTITSAAAATKVHCVLDSFVPSSATAIVTGFIGTVNGSTSWGTVTSCTIQDTAASPVSIASLAVAALTGNAVFGPFSSSITQSSAMKLGTGATKGKGLDLVCNATGTGSDLVLTVFGVLK